MMPVIVQLMVRGPPVSLVVPVSLGTIDESPIHRAGVRDVDRPIDVDLGPADIDLRSVPNVHRGPVDDPRPIPDAWPIAKARPIPDARPIAKARSVADAWPITNAWSIADAGPVGTG
jgi:hypothetical protein